MACVDKKPHALVVPASGQGHANACMLLARSLAALGFQVGFVYFSSGYANLLQAKNPTAGNAHACSGGSSNPKIHVVQDGISPSDIDKHFFYTPLMKDNLFQLILELKEQGTPLSCLIGDPFAPWTAHVAKRAHIPFVAYMTSSAMSYILACDLPLLFSQGILPEKGSPTQWKRETPLMLDHIPGMPPFSSELYPKDVRFADASHPFISLLNGVASCGKHAERMLIQTMYELEPNAFHAIAALEIPAYAIGPLLHHAKKQEGMVTSSQAKGSMSQPHEENECIAWLNMQAESSIIYIAFGTLASIPAEDIQELASGLEASGNGFLWVIGKNCLAGGAGLNQVLPDGFVDRIRGRGMIISWAPQMEVLAHKAIGGFLTHCGWNSTLESLWEGVPMLCCPYFADQHSNSHHICNVWGVGLELGRTKTGGIERRSVERGVKGLMQEEDGLKAREKAQEVMRLARKTCQQGGQSFTNLERFYEDMKQLCFESSNASS